MAFSNGLCALQRGTAIFDDGKSWKMKEPGKSYFPVPSLKKSMEGLFNSLLQIIPKPSTHSVNPLCMDSKNSSGGCREKQLRRSIIGRGERIRTSDPRNPIAVRYQTALRPDQNPAC